MKTCFDCSAELLDAAAFCHKCGRQITGKHRQSTLPTKERRETDEQLFAKSKAELDDLKLRIYKSAERNNLSMLALVLLFGGAAVLIFNSGSNNSGAYAAGAGVLAFLAFKGLAAKDRWLVENEYYSLSDSRDKNGEHRCIFCGGRGIYRKGEYASNVVYAGCSKCKSPLFTE